MAKITRREALKAISIGTAIGLGVAKLAKAAPEPIRIRCYRCLRRVESGDEHRNEDGWLLCPLCANALGLVEFPPTPPGFERRALSEMGPFSCCRCGVGLEEGDGPSAPGLIWLLCPDCEAGTRPDRAGPITINERAGLLESSMREIGADRDALAYPEGAQPLPLWAERD